MSTSASVRVVNRLIAGLPPEERDRILAKCESVDLQVGESLCDAGEVFPYVYFPLTACVSLVTKVSGHPPLEMGLIGNEGMLGATLALGVEAVPLRALVQGSGTALRMTPDEFSLQLREISQLLPILNRYLYVISAQMAQTTACTRFHSVEERLARWLLMTHDRSHADYFHLTHEVLAGMLGVRRSGITIAAGALQLRELIEYSRGAIQVLDRNGLEDASCECYAAVIDNYAQLLG